MLPALRPSSGGVPRPPADEHRAGGRCGPLDDISRDGFIAGPGDAMDWIRDLVPRDVVEEAASATGAMLVGRRTWDVGDRMKAEDAG